MDMLPGAAEAGERLKRTALRDFARVPEDYQRAGSSYRITIWPNDAPLPRLYWYALRLIGADGGGPGEKVVWWVDFTYRGEWCELAHQKFGLRLFLYTEASEEEAQKTMQEIVKKLRSSMRTVEKVILDIAPELLGKGNATVVNQHRSLLRAYEYFRERATNPVMIEDETIYHEPVEGSLISGGITFKSGKTQMQLNAFHDMIAAITAYLSVLEHVFVLALAFADFEPEKDDVTQVIGSRWGEKFDRLMGKDKQARRYRERLTQVVERWRNPYSHGGFEKGHDATIWLHTPGIGALPVGLTRLRTSPLFSLLPAGETAMSEVFELFDEIDAWVESELSEAMQWIHSGLDVQFDLGFREMFALARAEGDFKGFLEYHEYREAMVDNMDY
jgi:hypothetical protein